MRVALNSTSRLRRRDRAFRECPALVASGRNDQVKEMLDEEVPKDGRGRAGKHVEVASPVPRFWIGVDYWKSDRVAHKITPASPPNYSNRPKSGANSGTAGL